MSNYCEEHSDSHIKTVARTMNLDQVYTYIPTTIQGVSENQLNLNCELSELTQQLKHAQSRLQKVQKFHELLDERLSKQDIKIELLSSMTRSIQQNLILSISELSNSVSISKSFDRRSKSKCCIIY